MLGLSLPQLNLLHDMQKCKYGWAFFMGEVIFTLDRAIKELAKSHVTCARCNGLFHQQDVKNVGDGIYECEGCLAEAWREPPEALEGACEQNKPADDLDALALWFTIWSGGLVVCEIYPTPHRYDKVCRNPRPAEPVTLEVVLRVLERELKFCGHVVTFALLPGEYQVDLPIGDGTSGSIRDYGPDRKTALLRAAKQAVEAEEGEG